MFDSPKNGTSNLMTSVEKHLKHDVVNTLTSWRKDGWRWMRIRWRIIARGFAIPYGLTFMYWNFYTYFSTHLKNNSQIGNLPQVGVKIKNIWNHHLDTADGRRPANHLLHMEPYENHENRIFSRPQLVQDSFHQQYGANMRKYVLKNLQ